MKKQAIRYGILLSCMSLYVSHLQAGTTRSSTIKRTETAEWTIVCYIQADNNLAPFAEYNITDMQKIGSTNEVNILVQWDQPHNNKTWRYYIEKGKKTDAGSLNQEMGIKPAKELVDMMKWASTDFPAKHYMMVLWNHGNGVSDLRNGLITSPFNGWLQPPAGSTLSLNDLDIEELLSEQDRGILYDDSQHTFLSNRALKKVCKNIKKVLGKNIDIVGCDACLMAMIEVAYNMRNCVDVYVASQELEPGEGWPYSGFLEALVEKPSLFTAEDVGNAVVTAYDEFYKDDSTHTQSSVNMSKVDLLCKTLNNLSQELINAHKIDASETLKILTNARKNATEFYFQDYIDLHSFLTQLLDQTKRSQHRLISIQETGDRTDFERKNKFKTRLNRIKTITETTQQALLNSVTANLVGTSYSQAKGISIYFPSGKKIDRTYKKTPFARKTKWLSLLRAIGKN